MGKLANLLRKAMVVSMEDQISYCNKTIQVGPHILVVTTATVDTTGERRRKIVIAGVRKKCSETWDVQMYHRFVSFPAMVGIHVIHRLPPRRITLLVDKGAPGF